MNTLFHVTDAEKTFSVLTVDSTETIREMQRMHKLDKDGATALSKLLTAAALMSTMLVQNETLTLTAEGILNKGTAVAIAASDGTVRGFFDADEETDAKRQIPMLKVMRRAGLSEPRMSFCALAPDSMAESFTEYYRACEQMQALCRLETKFSEDESEIQFAGGVFLLPWTKSKSELMERVEAFLKEADLETFVKAENGEAPLLKHFPEAEFLMRDEKQAMYHCTCSLERMERSLQSIGTMALSELLEDEYTEIHCRFCDQKYLFSRESIRDLLAELEAAQKAAEAENIQ